MQNPPPSSRPVRVLLATMLCTLLATPALAGSFEVEDGYGEGEVSEVSRLYVDEQLVATFHLDHDHTTQTAHVETPVSRVNHSYALCGEITIRRPAGKIEIHQVSGEGVLHEPDGHHLVALGARNFTEFYLADPDDPNVVERHPGRSSLCAAPTS
ncbi:hypothetical protein CFR78_08365 [Komagataeibacter rhaeticus]|uniref:hypothetical protein n=1 Tax=Komagataeibacter rhaeticus TaxID=215221 RepID=UPI0004D7CBC9|nr:hypothetical protein [Komagataeibacter rhaeticus]KDU94611.1 hypothetical protein GLUCORHAEAF1_12960 [Komagataeibacter rhaeticus AF1]MBL7238602.1 hypothetical protein [Komagataeibacter rhaeticus]PYD53635.1 hypothetical protein CFR78_08365 [Komagataeibacter rhaeticus]